MIKLVIRVEGETPADCVRLALRHVEDFAGMIPDGGKAKAVFRAWTRDDEVAKLTERRDRWRQRAEACKRRSEVYLRQRWAAEERAKAAEAQLAAEMSSRLEQVFRDCGYTKIEGNRDLLSAIHGCLEGIRADLRRSLEARRS